MLQVLKNNFFEEKSTSIKHICRSFLYLLTKSPSLKGVFVQIFFKLIAHKDMT